MVKSPAKSNMSKDWIEWVPNISEGKNPEFINDLVNKLNLITDVYVIHKDIGLDAHRTVLTVIGTKEALETAVDQLMFQLERNVDMSGHIGKHPRLGALDVSPFIPLNGKNVEDTIDWTRSLAQTIAQKYSLPIYLYEKSAKIQTRKNLATIRKGEYENLSNKMKLPEWKPDFGEKFNPYLGATVMGVRDFLVAYNVNLESKNQIIAKKIASIVRTKGAGKRPYALPGLKAIGWYMDSFGKIQISTNIVDTTQTTMVEVFDRCKTLAAGYGIEVQESELIGLIPRTMLIKMKEKTGLSNIELAKKLGLGFCGITDLEERTIEYNFTKISGVRL
ncbi:glutamate formimidoyltransferase [Membranihabitans maritimus]|uniref:glutamate formimidoyltransferase n=1 Tax=Membranihabitans maritimus TaxID=2904244 RepID=UPI001F027DBB|nr:glutamate formimidoyltransferase [Membranihabitans maritimus]